ncbi:AI-2E family transporter [Clostridium sp. Ade.TY]|uniref:AI-2E family transporter n=1 Tax=Clostridium sp. Ade.TY TaxID=1391647 RepID=UPI0004289B26|nr:AI-2E family transporter [Clostridium sp. Ade.TY]
MKFQIKNRLFILKILIAILLITFIILYFNWEIFREVVNIIIISAILAYVLRPLRNLLMAKGIFSKRQSTLIVMFGIIILVTILLSILLPNIINEFSNSSYIIDEFSLYIKEFGEKMKIDDSSLTGTIYKELETKIWGYIMELSRSIINWIVEFTSDIFSIAVIPIVSYYFLADGESISNKAYLLVPLEKRRITKNIINDVNMLLERYILSQVLLSLGTGIMCLILFLILDLKFAFLLAIINGIFNIVPYFGAVFGGIPAVFIALIDSPAKGLWTIIGILIIQQIEGNLLAPKLTADSTNIHAIIIIIILLVGEKIGGVFGMILAVPVGVILKVIYDDLNYYLF